MPRESTLLLVEDDAAFRLSAADAFRAAGMQVLEAGSCAAAREAARRHRIDVVLLDQSLPDGRGVELCADLLAANDRTKIVFASAHADFSHAVAALRSGAFDYVSKPVALEELEHVVARALRTSDLERQAQAHQYEASQAASRAVLVGGDGGLAEVRRLADMAAASDAPVLITGETGTGKNVVARYIHHHGPRPDAPFLSVNAAAIPRELVESELFGHEKGAFTGAERARRGLFELADRGTLFLDEIGDLPLEAQAKLLSVVEEQLVRRVGGEAPRPVRVRILAATNADLPARVRERTFREDLYYRLNVIHVHVPPLRERTGDLPALCRQLVAQITGGQDAVVPAEEIERLAAYPWPGNVRELRNVLERARALQPGRTLRPSEFLPAPARAAPPPPPSGCPVGELVPLDEVERLHMRRVLERVGGNLARAARELRVSESTLRRRLRAPP